MLHPRWNCKCALKAFFTRTAKCSGLHVVPAETQSTKQRLMLSDQLNYLPGDILVKTDRCAMAHSLETRAPFLDHRVVQAAMNLPDTQLRDKVGGKVILKSILSKHLPASCGTDPKGLRCTDWRMVMVVQCAHGRKIYYLPIEFTKTNSPSPKLIRRIGHCTQNHMNLQDVLWPILILQNWHSTLERDVTDVDMVAGSEVGTKDYCIILDQRHATTSWAPQFRLATSIKGHSQIT